MEQVIERIKQGLSVSDFERIANPVKQGLRNVELGSIKKNRAQDLLFNQGLIFNPAPNAIQKKAIADAASTPGAVGVGFAGDVKAVPGLAQATALGLSGQQTPITSKLLTNQVQRTTEIANAKFDPDATRIINQIKQGILTPQEALQHVQSLDPDVGRNARTLQVVTAFVDGRMPLMDIESIVNSVRNGFLDKAQGKAALINAVNQIKNAPDTSPLAAYKSVADSFLSFIN